MKAFKEWNKRRNPEPNAVFYLNRMEGWKAALEWVLSIDSGLCNCGSPNDSWDNPSVLARIKEELEDVG